MNGFGIDLSNIRDTFHSESFGLGVLAGWATAYVLYRTRHTLGAARRAVERQARTAEEFASRSADSRYIGDLTQFCKTNHLAGKTINLPDILVEPRFILAPELVKPREDDVVRSVFHVVPRIPDHPYLHAPYNIPTISIEELSEGDRTIALLGLPGSGRTTTLQTIALWSLGEVKFEPPVDQVQQRLEEEEAALDSDEERAQRIRERIQMEQMALESLANKRGVDPDELAKQVAAKGKLFKQLTPIYAHFANVHSRAREFGRTVDPAEPLLRAVQQHTGRVTSRTLAAHFYERLNEGKALLLIDGFDEIPARDHPRALSWLAALVDQYDHNFIIVTGPASGYGGLVNAGLAPVFLRPWNDVTTAALADLWSEHWQQISGKRRRDAELDHRTLSYARSRNRGHTPFELVAKIWATYEAQDTTDNDTRLNHLLQQYLPEKELNVLLPKLVTAATIQLDEGYITAARLDEVIEGGATPGRVVPEDEELAELVEEEAEGISDLEAADETFEEVFAEDLDADEALFGAEDDELSEFAAELAEEGEEFGEVEPEPEELGLAEAAPVADKKKDKTIKEYIQLVEKLYKAGLLTRYRGERYQFRHPLIAAYFASRSLQEADEETLKTRALAPGWQSALTYAAMHTPLELAVQARLEAEADILQNTLLDMMYWLAYAEGKVEWRATLLRQLGNMFVAPNQYQAIRERVAAALISTRDRNAARVFERSLRHPNPDVRRLACLGAGALQAEDAIGTLTNLLVDPDADVTLAAGLALGAIGTEAALEEMVVALTEGQENLRQAVAEAFASIPDEGYPVLFDAAHAEDMMLRRAAVFGLRRINTPWALIALYRRSIEDDQWYVRSAAETAFEEMQYGGGARGARHYPPIESIPWLREWVTDLGQEAGEATEGDSAALLRRALEQGGPMVQMLSAANMGQLGLAAETGLLYTTLRHREDEVREAAFRALSDIQLHLGQPLPSPL